MKEIKCEKLLQVLDKGYLIIDTRSYHEYLTGIIKNSVHVSQVLRNIKDYANSEKVIIYCGTSGRTRNMYSFFEKLFANVYLLDTGIKGWKEKGYEIVIPSKLEHYPSEKITFFNYAATTPVFPEVVEVMKKYMDFSGNFSNPACSHVLGGSASNEIVKAGKKLAKYINATPDSIVWTSGATESDNLAIKGFIEANQNAKKHVITTSIEHKAVIDVCEYLKDLGQIEVSYLSVNEHGQIDLKELENLIREETILISVMAVNNELGTVNPIKEVGAIAKKNNIAFHVDGAQGLGKIDIDVEDMNIDMLAISAHKCYGPKGIGALYIRNGIKIAEQIHGGGHQNRMRSGTLATQQIVGFAAAVEQMFNQDKNYIKNLRKTFLAGIKEIKGLNINTPLDSSYAGILSVTVEGVNGDLLMSLMSEVAISMSSACSSSSAKPSYVLAQIGLSNEQAKSTLRISFGYSTTEQDVLNLVNILKERINLVRQAVS